MPYAITCGLPGCYMPDVCEHHWTKADAQSSAVFWANTYREDWDSRYRIEGSARKGGYDIFNDEKTCSHVATIRIDEISKYDFAPDCECGRETEPTNEGPRCSECGLDVRD